ncbi:MAG: DNA polymerase III subunit gamma/tau [Vampirovibrionales bacterium]|nr:DNA polymerase III subunit gamma/tau [Vampirovibrionales bacterium]
MTAIATYLPLYRRYRPQQFAEVVGQQPIIQTLSNAITSGKVAHAYLFCGPRGTGKTSTARILAKSLNCATGPTLTPCGTCPSCLGILKGNALDVVEIDAASHNGVADARDLIETCQFAPMQGRYKVYIIDEVHMLSTAAFNALLKTLEEPPPHVVFILATTETHKVLPTIVSRCQRFDFSRIGLSELKTHLAHVSQQEDLKLTDEAILAIARHARGGLRDALSQLDQVGVLSRVDAAYTITDADVQRFLGTLADDSVQRVINAMLDKDVTTLMTGIEALCADGAEPRQVVQALTQQVRQLMLAAAIVGNASDLTPKVQDTVADILGISAAAVPAIVAQAQRIATDEYPQWLMALSQLEYQVRQNSLPQLWLEVGLVALAHREGIETIQHLSNRIAALEKQLEKQLSGGVLPAATTPVPSQATPTLSVTPQAHSPSVSMPSVAASPTQTILETPQPLPTSQPAPALAPRPITSGSGLDWHQVVAAIASMGVRAMITQQAHLVSADASTITVACHSEAILNTLKNPTKLIHLNKAIEAVTGQALQVHLIVEKPSVSASPLPLQPQESNSAVSAFSPNVQPEPAPPMHEATTTVATEEPTPASASNALEPPITQRLSQQELNAPNWDDAKQFTAQLLQGTVI